VLWLTKDTFLYKDDIPSLAAIAFDPTRVRETYLEDWWRFPRQGMALSDFQYDRFRTAAEHDLEADLERWGGASTVF
jgi:hypothetical protein